MNEEYLQGGRIKQKRKTRDRILAGAKQLLTKSSSFTLDDVAEVTSLSRATIYRYFSSAEALSLEAALDLGTKSPEEVLAIIDGKDTGHMLGAIQNYFNQLSLDNEAVFRKYLSVVITQPPEGRVRGARRHHTLELALEKLDLPMNKKEREKFIVAATALMGIEPIIVTKDVCGLSDAESLDVLSWGLQMMLRGILSR